MNRFGSADAAVAARRVLFISSPARAFRYYPPLFLILLFRSHLLFYMQTVLYALEIETRDIFKGTEKCMWNKTSRALFSFAVQSASIIFLRRFENHFVFWDKNQIICSRGNQLLASRTKENAVSLACARGAVRTARRDAAGIIIQLQSPSEITVNFLSAC
jgi:hypothetical protein